MELAPGHSEATAGLVLLFSSAAALVGSPVKARTPPPTAGWTASRTGGGLRAFRPRRSDGPVGRVAAAELRPRPARTWRSAGRRRHAIAHGDTAITPDEGAYAFEALMRHDRAYTGYARSRERRGSLPSRNAAGSLNCSGPPTKANSDESKFRAS